MTKITRWSYLSLLITLGLVGFLRLGTPFIAVLLSYLALNVLKFRQKKAIAVFLYIVLVIAFFYGLQFFAKQALATLPQVVTRLIPTLVDFANNHGIELPFQDLESLKAVMTMTIADEFGYYANFASIATKEFAFIIIGMVVAVGIFINGKLDLDEGRYPIQNNLYSLICEEVANRFTAFYQSFATVMGAQIVISTINTSFTGVFLFFTPLPHRMIIVVITFLCGLLPIIGNILSNTVIVCIALTVSPRWAIAALLFLIFLHKLEYFLNSKIIGGRIKNPMWLTLLSLILGERLMGVQGMILAPVVLNYIKMECSKIAIDNQAGIVV